LSQELTKEQIEMKLHSNDLDSYEQFKSTWNIIEKDTVNWQLHRITTDIPFTQGNSEGRINRIKIHPEIPGLYFAGTSTNGLWRSDDFAENWEYLNISDFNFGITEIEISGKDKNQLLIISGDQKIEGISKSQFRGLYFSNDLGENFTEIDLSTLDTKPVDIIAYKESFILLSESKIYQLNSDLSFTEIQTDIPLIDQYFYQIVKYDDNQFGLSIRNRDNLGSTYHIVRFDDSKLKSKFFYQNVAQQVRFVPDLHFDTKSNRYKTRILEIIRTNIPKLTTIALNENNEAEINTSDLPSEFILWQGEFNHALFSLPIDTDIIYGGGINNYTTKNAGEDWQMNMNGVHTDFHDISYDELTGEVFAATDGGIYSQDLGDTIWNYRSKGITAGQFFWGDVSDFNPNEFVGGKMDNGTFYRYFDENKPIAGGDGMWCHFANKNDSIITVSAQNSNFARYSKNSNTFELLLFDTLNTTRKPWMTRYQIDGDSIWLYQDDIWKYDNSEWKNLTNHSDSVKYAEKFGDTIFYINQTTELFSIVNGEIEKYKLEKSYMNIVDMLHLKDEKTLILVNNRNDEGHQVLLINTDTKELKNSYFLLDGITFNCIEKFGDNYLLGTDDGIFQINKDFDINSIKNLYDSSMPLRGVRRIVNKKEYGYIYAFTYGQDLRRLKINDCADKKILTNLQDTIYKCPEVSIEFSIIDKEDDTDYILNNEIIGDKFLLEKEGQYFIIAYDNSCIYSSNNIELINYSVPEMNVRTNSFYNFICDTNRIELELRSDSDLIGRNILWNTGEIGRFIEVSEPGKYWAEYTTENDCKVISDTIFVKEGRDKFYKPELEYVNGSLIEKNGNILNWFFNGEILQRGANSIELNEFGTYEAIYLNDSCSVWSEIYEHKPTGEIIISPNPGFNQIGIDILIDMQDEYFIEIQDTNGKVIYSEIFDKNGYNYIKLNASDLATGHYFLTLRGKSIYKTQKFIILN
jgi:hypothetical protein